MKKYIKIVIVTLIALAILSGIGYVYKQAMKKERKESPRLCLNSSTDRVRVRVRV